MYAAYITSVQYLVFKDTLTEMRDKQSKLRFEPSLLLSPSLGFVFLGREKGKKDLKEEKDNNIEGQWKGLKSLSLRKGETWGGLGRSSGRRRRGRDAVYKSLSP